jgi:penicillin amidase
MKKYKWIIPITPLIIIALLWFTPLGPIIKYQISPHYPTNETQTLTLPKLSAEVSVYFDNWGIPHIEAQNLSDLMLATGFIQARYRFFQLDVLRRFAGGRISELVGDQPVLSTSTVEMDLAMRGWRFKEMTVLDENLMTPLDKELLTNFTLGINLALKKYPPVEYDFLGTTAEPWDISDTLIVSLLQAWSITHNWEQEAVKFAMHLSLGQEVANQIYPQDAFPGEATIEKQNAKKISLPPGIVPEVSELLQAIPKTTFTPYSHKQLVSTLGDLAQIRPSASNAWLVGKSRSKSGAPILANDMHLTHALPSMIFLQHLKSPELDIIGGTLPGLPFIISGYNGHVAWGSTSAVADVVDLYIEKIDENNPTEVIDETGSCPLITTEQVIKIRGSKSKKFLMRKSCRGTIFNDMYPDFFSPSAPLLSLKWELPNVQKSFSNILKANQAKNVYELRDAMMKLPVPIQNIMATDHDGNIAFFTTGSVPIRKNHRGTFPVPGWLAKYAWDGKTAKDDMPHQFNPPSDYLINTNNKVVNPNHHWPIFHVEAAPSYRFERAKELILSKKKHQQEDIKNIQQDHILQRAKLITPKLVEDLETIVNKSEEDKALIKLLKNWDYSSGVDSNAMSLFASIFRESIILALQNKISAQTLHVFLKQRYSTNTVDLWFMDEQHIVWDNFATETKEKRTDVVKQAYQIAKTKLNNKFGPNIQNWKWGELHYLSPKHIFGKKTVLSFMNLADTPLAGSLDSVWKAHFNFVDENEPFKTVAGPAYRFVIDMKHPEKAEFSNDTGVSGWPLSPHYGDIFEQWKQGQLVPMLRDWKKIKKDFQHQKMTLKPHE